MSTVIVRTAVDSDEELLKRNYRFKITLSPHCGQLPQPETATPLGYAHLP